MIDSERYPYPLNTPPDSLEAYSLDASPDSVEARQWSDIGRTPLVSAAALCASECQIVDDGTEVKGVQYPEGLLGGSDIIAVLNDGRQPEEVRTQISVPSSIAQIETYEYNKRIPDATYLSDGRAIHPKDLYRHQNVAGVAVRELADISN